jgi:hypothetical protein
VTVTKTQIPTLTEEFSPTPTEESTPVPTMGPNLFKNPDFEGVVRSVIFSEVNVFEEWEPFYCDEPYTPEKCPAFLTGQQNPPDLLMGRPEYKPIEGVNPYSGGNAQQWFCFYRTCMAGVYQTVPTAPNSTCEVSFMVRSWSSYEDLNPNDGIDLSELLTDDDKANSWWFILVDQYGGNYAFATENIPARPDKQLAPTDQFPRIYDQWFEVSMSFTALSDSATIFVGNGRLFPIRNNDSYVDHASIKCEGVTPEPTKTPLPTPTRIFSCEYGADVENQNWKFTALYNLIVRTKPIREASTNTGQLLSVGRTVKVICIYTPSSSERWIKFDGGWVASSLDTNNDGIGETFGELTQ